MVNRILIRVKVVQMLYSYLLTRSEFKINDAPETASRDKKYAYSVYLDMLLLIMELSGYSVKAGERPRLVPDKKLAANKVAKALSNIDAIKSTILRGNTQIGSLDEVAPQLLAKIQASEVFSDYSKKRNPELADDVMLWTTILGSIIAKDESIVEALRATGDFTNAGYERGIKDVCETLRSYADTKELLRKAKRDLTASLDKAYELYLNLFSLIIDITEEQNRRIETGKTKLLASAEDLNPNMRLANNQLVTYLKDSEHFAELLEEYAVKREDPASTLVRTLLDKILESELYKEYITSSETGLKADTEFWREAMRQIVLPSDALVEELEDRSVYWNDDLQTMGTFMLKTLRQIAQSAKDGSKVELLPKFKDLEDEEFGPKLFMLAVDNQEQYRQYIEKFIERSNWDPERLAFMDIVVMTAAIAEIIHFPLIPVAVSVNEYVEIANNYSTDKSGGFINGILYSIIKFLNEEGIIHKN